MNAASFFDWLRAGVEINLKEKAITITAGPVKIKHLSFDGARELMADRIRIEQFLSILFVQRGVMWEDYRREHVDECINSLREIQLELQEFAKGISGSNRQTKAALSLGSCLYAWANCCDEAATVLDQAKEAENDPFEDSKAHQYIPLVLRDLRQKTYPIVDLLISLLPKDSMVKDQAIEKLDWGKTTAVRHLNASTAELQSAEVEIP